MPLENLGCPACTGRFCGGRANAHQWQLVARKRPEARGNVSGQCMTASRRVRLPALFIVAGVGRQEGTGIHRDFLVAGSALSGTAPTILHMAMDGHGQWCPYFLDTPSCHSPAKTPFQADIFGHALRRWTGHESSHTVTVIATSRPQGASPWQDVPSLARTHSARRCARKCWRSAAAQRKSRRRSAPAGGCDQERPGAMPTAGPCSRWPTASTLSRPAGQSMPSPPMPRWWASGRSGPTRRAGVRV